MRPALRDTRPIPDPIRGFYKTNLPDLSGITDLSHRHFRFILPTGNFLKIKDRIKNPDCLRTWLVRYRPMDVYYSTSCWLAPETIGRKDRTPLSSNIFLSSDIVFDIDRSPFSVKNIEKARIDTLRLLQFCHGSGLATRYIAFSGSKGFHVVCTDRQRYSDTDPLIREEMAKAVRKEIVARVLNLGIEVDSTITTDTRRILRVPGTINSKTGFVCTSLTQDQMMLPASDLLKFIPTVRMPNGSGQRSVVPPFPGTRILTWFCEKLPHSKGHQTPCSFATYIVNAVPGIPRQIPFFSYPCQRKADQVLDELDAIQRKYDLTDIYVFKSEDGISAFSLRTFPLRRLEKILGSSTSPNYATLLKFKQLFFRVGVRQDECSKTISHAPVFFQVLPAKDHSNAYFVSAPHYRFFSGYPIPLRRASRMHGNGDVFVTYVIMKDF